MENEAQLKLQREMTITNDLYQKLSKQVYKDEAIELFTKMGKGGSLLKKLYILWPNMEFSLLELKLILIFVLITWW